ncbi:GNAT family N-acetyltransferase [Aminipila sp.]|uniref:GNAT family N-acetyltransferase n=1 Tax=Aminipila sp. TaxID=2060095 RepID=UPI002F40BF82
MVIETERLEIVPLNPNQLRLWVEEISMLEKELNCKYKAEPMEGFFHDIVRGQLDITEQDRDNYLFHSFWFLIRKEDRVVVGSADFKDIPNEKGEVEIGYGLGKAFEHNGYMTEAVQAMCGWAMEQPGVTHIIAETDLDGYASHRILERCGFVKTEQGETLWWRNKGVISDNTKLELKRKRKEKLRSNKILKAISLIVALILPISTLLYIPLIMENYDFLNPYNYLWAGFYGSILVFIFYKSKLLKGTIISLNILLLLCLLFFSLMGGIQGLTTSIIRMVLPLIPYKVAMGFSIQIFPLSKFPPV